MSVDQLGLDQSAFGISLLEAQSIDPQQRFVLCVGYSALHEAYSHHACLQRSSLRDFLTYTDIGVFVGVEPSGFRVSECDASVFSSSGGALSVTSGRLSFTLGLVGSCYSIDTACSSALVALHTCGTAI